MKKKVLAALTLLITTLTFAMPNYNGDRPATLVGKVQVLKGLEDTYEGAEKDRYPAISLTNIITITTDEGQVKTRLIQLVDLTSSGNVLPKSFYKKVGNPITVICESFYHSDNAHHITKALCIVKKVSFS